MGNNHAKLSSALERGDASAVRSLLKDPSISDVFNPCFASDREDGVSPLHLVCHHAALDLLENFLERGGDVSHIDREGRTSLHHVVITAPIGHPKHPPRASPEQRLLCLQIVLDNMRGSVNLVDALGNTPLHYAASSGLLNCCKELVAKGVNVYALNIDGLTAADLAHTHKHPETRDFLEACMIVGTVFTRDALIMGPGIARAPSDGLIRQISFRVLQDEATIQMSRDQCVAFVSSRLDLSEHVAEALLSACGWDRFKVVESYFKSPEKLFQEANVPLPDQALPASRVTQHETVVLAAQATQPQMAVAEAAESGGKEEEEQKTAAASEEAEDGYCDICLEEFPPLQLFGLECGHLFCIPCWQNYLEGQILSAAVQFECIAHGCTKRCPSSFVEGILSSRPDLLEKLRSFKVSTYVDRAEGLRWCPNPRCQKAVEHPHGSTTSEVSCSCGHSFCWGCLEEPHDPCPCSFWKRWKLILDKASGQEADPLAGATNWLAQNCKPCPKCSILIQKNGGCLHMTCRNCRHQWCWNCSGDWSTHGSNTGGFFSCNKAEEAKKAAEAIKKKLGVHKTQKIDFHISQFWLHESWIRVEDRRMAKALDKAIELENTIRQHIVPSPELCDSLGYAPPTAVASPTIGETKDGEVALANPLLEGTGGSEINNLKDMNFLLDAVYQLSRNRHALRNSCAVGYLLTKGIENQQFQYLQGELEGATADLRQALAQSPLRHPRSEIKKRTKEAHAKYNEFMKLMREMMKKSDKFSRSKAAEEKKSSN